MQLKPLIAALLIGAAAMSGCKQDATPAAPAASPTPETRALEPVGLAPANEGVRLNLPALPVIRNAVFSLVPLFNGARNPQIMAQICGLARGELTQGQVNTFLGQLSIDPAKLPRTGHPLSLLVNGDKADQMTACASYLATSVLLKPDTSEFMKTVKVADKPAPNKVQVKLRGKTEQPATRTEQQIDSAALAKVLPEKLAIARANADLFALIASELEKQPGLTLGEYRGQAMRLFARLAPVYLERIEGQRPGLGVRLEVTRMQGDELAFRGSDGSRFIFDGDDLRLIQNDMLWFGEGKLLGQDYVLKVAYFDPTVSKLLAPVKL